MKFDKSANVFQPANFREAVLLLGDSDRKKLAFELYAEKRDTDVWVSYYDNDLIHYRLDSYSVTVHDWPTPDVRKILRDLTPAHYIRRAGMLAVNSFLNELVGNRWVVCPWPDGRPLTQEEAWQNLPTATRHIVNYTAKQMVAELTSAAPLHSRVQGGWPQPESPLTAHVRSAESTNASSVAPCVPSATTLPVISPNSDPTN